MSKSFAVDALRAIIWGLLLVIVIDVILNIHTYSRFVDVPMSTSAEGKAHIEALRRTRVQMADIPKKHGTGEHIFLKVLNETVIQNEEKKSWTPSAFLPHEDVTIKSLSRGPTSVLNAFKMSPMKTIFQKSGSKLLFDSLDVHFPRYSANGTVLPTWILTPGDKSHVHRFFDSSPISPSGRYLALTRVPDVYISSLNTAADVTVIDLLNGQDQTVASTTAWGAQLGAQVQWGANDTQLFYNIQSSSLANEKHMSEPIPNYKRRMSHSKQDPAGTSRSDALSRELPDFLQKRVVGVVMNLQNREQRILQCPVYHVSPSGEYTVAPNMHKIRHVQMGYGADYADGPNEGYADYGLNDKASDQDGIYVNEVLSGRCTRIITLLELARAAGIEDGVAVFGFHTKWSPDGELIMVVLRSLHPQPGLQGLVSPIRVRRQHLLVVHKDGSQVLHLKSWSSLPFRASGFLGFTVEETDPEDGNHPNWAVFTDFQTSGDAKTRTVRHITMNVRVRTRATSRRVGPRAQDGSDDENASHLLGWNVMQIDVDAAYAAIRVPKSAVADTSIAGASPVNHAHQQSAISALWTKIWSKGTGHPTLLLSASAGIGDSEDTGRKLLLMDAYAKESRLFDSTALDRAFPGSNPAVLQRSVPLRLVDTSSGKEVWLLRMQLQPDIGAHVQHELSLVEQGNAGDTLSNKHKRAWRCDMHPVLGGPNAAWIVFNGRPEGGRRQVLISFAGARLATLFDRAPSLPRH